MCLICISLDNGAMNEYEARLALVEMRSEIGPHADEVERKLRQQGRKGVTFSIPASPWDPSIAEEMEKLHEAVRRGYEATAQPLPLDCTAPVVANRIKAYLPSFLATPVGPMDSGSILGGVIEAIAQASEEAYRSLLKIANDLDLDSNGNRIVGMASLARTEDGNSASEYLKLPELPTDCPAFQHTWCPMIETTSQLPADPNHGDICLMNVPSKILNRQCAAVALGNKWHRIFLDILSR